MLYFFPSQGPRVESGVGANGQRDSILVFLRFSWMEFTFIVALVTRNINFSNSKGFCGIGLSHFLELPSWTETDKLMLTRWEGGMKSFIWKDIFSEQIYKCLKPKMIFGIGLSHLLETTSWTETDKLMLTLWEGGMKSSIWKDIFSEKI